MTIERPLLVLSQVAEILAAQDITYVLVGSFASSMHGMYRSTADIDILADIKPKHVIRLLKALEKSFDVDELTIRDAIERRKSFNAIHFESVFKVDIFIPKADDFDAMQLARRQPRTISADLSQTVYVATAEDTILAKLRWYRDGDEVSTTQWSDVLGIIAANSDLERSYMDLWAKNLGVIDLLEKAFEETTELQ